VTIAEIRELYSKSKLMSERENAKHQDVCEAMGHERFNTMYPIGAKLQFIIDERMYSGKAVGYRLFNIIVESEAGRKYVVFPEDILNVQNKQVV
jgi:hypothetical protein